MHSIPDPPPHLQAGAQVSNYGRVFGYGYASPQSIFGVYGATTTPWSPSIDQPAQFDASPTGMANGDGSVTMEAGGMKWCWDYNPNACAVSPFVSWRDPAGNGVLGIHYWVTFPSDSWQWYMVVNTGNGCYQGDWWNGYAWDGLNDPAETCFGIGFDAVATGAESSDIGLATGRANAYYDQLWSTDTWNWNQWCWVNPYANMPNWFIYPNPCYLNYVWSFAGW